MSRAEQLRLLSVQTKHYGYMLLSLARLVAEGVVLNHDECAEMMRHAGAIAFACGELSAPAEPKPTGDVIISEIEHSDRGRPTPRESPASRAR